MSNHLILLLTCLFFCNSIAAQTTSTPSIWSEKQAKSISPAGKRLINPDVFKTLELDETAMHSLLASAPKEGVKNTATSQTILPIPLSDGTVEEFRIVEYNMMEAGLQTQYPAFKTYYGRGVKDPLKRVRLSWTQAGFRAMISTAQGMSFIDPFSQNDTKHYLSYFKKDYPQPTEIFQCGTEHEEIKLVDEYGTLEKSGDCTFRSYRTAVAVTGEYSNFFGVSSSAGEATILSEVMTSINRINDVYEVDFSVRLILTANTTQVFYYNGSTDPYTNSEGSTMLAENTATLNSVLTSSTFDIGHVYSTGGGGVATLRSPCTVNKARGVTGRFAPTNDPFWIDFVAHELGHQFGGNHTQNNSCQRSSQSYEPGSASTIMGYAGICSPNVQNNSDAYFHSANIEEVGLFVTGVTGSGNTCATVIANPNTAPTVNAGSDYTIPASTPFVLTATGSDTENDPMTYCWEQFDNSVATMPPVSTNTVGPTFRSLFATTSDQRYFPKLATVIANGTDMWEVLPSVTRTMNFRVLVRDNSANTASCTDEDDMIVSVAGAAGPFLVTAPTNANLAWIEGETKTVTWDVAGTTGNGINCANVDILLSTDSGLTYLTTLASNVTNNGSASIIVPLGATMTARVMVKCSDNIFYDISNNDFEIEAESASFTMEIVPPNLSVCSGQDASYTVNTNALAGFSGNVVLSASNVPAGANLTFGSNSISAGSSTSITVGNTASISPGTYTIDIMGSSTSLTRNASITLVVNEIPTAVSLSAPIDGTIDESTSLTLAWAAISEVTSYQIQVSLDSGFGNIVSDQTSLTNATIPTNLVPNTIYYWRARAFAPCEGSWSSVGNFTTENCISTIQNTPEILSSVGTPTTTSTYNVSQTGTVSSLTVSNITGTHTWISDLTMTLISPDGTISVELLSGLCGNNNDFNIGFDDVATTALANINCTPSMGAGGTFIPANPLSAFNGTNVNGNWTLQIDDGANNDGGQLDSWSLNICLESPAEPLSVEWLSFSATAQKSDIRLDWATAEEINNAGFEIERRAENDSEFTYIGKVDATTIANDVNHYSFIDTDVKMGIVYYYRIRQYDLDAYSSLSEIESAKIENRDGNFSVYPNPVRETIFGLVNVENATETQARLFDVQGKLLKEITFEGNEFNMSVSDLPSGFYFLEMQAGSVHQVEKVIVD